MTVFLKGLIIGFVVGLVIMGLILGLVITHYKNKELKEYAEKQTEIQALQEEYSSRPADEFLADPGVRRAVDGATGDFERKRDEAVQRFRSGLSD